MGVIWHSRDSKMVAGDAEIDPCPGCTIERLRAEIERLKSERENVECEECGFEYHSRHFEDGRPCPVCEVERMTVERSAAIAMAKSLCRGEGEMNDQKTPLTPERPIPALAKVINDHQEAIKQLQELVENHARVIKEMLAVINSIK